MLANPLSAHRPMKSLMAIGLFLTLLESLLPALPTSGGSASPAVADGRTAIARSTDETTAVAGSPVTGSEGDGDSDTPDPGGNGGGGSGSGG